MKAVIVREHGGLEALRYEEVEDPRPAAGEVLVEVRASGVNHLDLWVRRGVPSYTFPLPLIPGNDVPWIALEAGEGAEALFLARGSLELRTLDFDALTQGPEHQEQDEGSV